MRSAGRGRGRSPHYAGDVARVVRESMRQVRGSVALTAVTAPSHRGDECGRDRGVEPVRKRAVAASECSASRRDVAALAAASAAGAGAGGTTPGARTGSSPRHLGHGFVRCSRADRPVRRAVPGALRGIRVRIYRRPAEGTPPETARRSPGHEQAEAGHGLRFAGAGGIVCGALRERRAARAIPRRNRQELARNVGASGAGRDEWLEPRAMRVGPPGLARTERNLGSAAPVPAGSADGAPVDPTTFMVASPSLCRVSGVVAEGDVLGQPGIRRATGRGRPGGVARPGVWGGRRSAGCLLYDEAWTT